MSSLNTFLNSKYGVFTTDKQSKTVDKVDLSKFIDEITSKRVKLQPHISSEKDTKNGWEISKFSNQATLTGGTNTNLKLELDCEFNPKVTKSMKKTIFIRFKIENFSNFLSFYREITHF